MRHRIFVVYVALMVVAFLAPAPSTPLAETSHLDKLVHFGIFLGFALLLHVDRAPKVWLTLLASFAFAAAVELVQSVLPYREGDVWDWVAGAAGAIVAIAFIPLFGRPGRGRRGG
ncbi:MAG: VanZ family protein [Gemmatimonadales bacterium]